MGSPIMPRIPQTNDQGEREMRDSQKQNGSRRESDRGGIGGWGGKNEGGSE